MTRSATDAQEWADRGTTLILDAVGTLSQTELEAPSRLPGWTRKHLVAHVAANADALGHLVHWAATGEETPMYSSLEERDAQIQRAASLEGAELVTWLRRSADELARSTSTLTRVQWQASVRTAQGRTVPATEVTWMRAREVLVHAVDLGTATTFADLPEEFLDALVTEICVKRGLERSAVPAGPLPEQAAWLAGRPHTLAEAPLLDRWL